MEATFVKANGEKRTMKYIVMGELDEQFKKQHIKGTGKPKSNPDLATVWDVERDAFRTINTKTIIGIARVWGEGLLAEDLQRYVIAEARPCVN